MSTFTVYCHGTGFNRIKGSQADELVAFFHNNTGGVEATLSGSVVTPGDYMVNNGPGHTGDGLAQPQLVNPISGDAKPGYSVKKSFTKTSFADHASGNTGNASKKFAALKGTLDGEGWDENVVRTLNVIQDLKFEKGLPIDRVNMVGWSRGAVTCIRIAAALYEVFNTEIECNIFAVDPVAGKDAGLKMKDTRVLNQNVKGFVGILAMHEMRKTFNPQDWSRVNASPGTRAVMLPMPGVHNAQVMASNPADAAYVTRNLAGGLLKKWGTPITRTPFNFLSSPKDMSIAYGRLVLSLSEHKSYETNSLKGRTTGGSPGGLRRRDFAKTSKMDLYTRGGKEGYWINEHHRACFAEAFPDIYDLIFESTTSGGEVALTSRSKYAAFFNAISQGAGVPIRNSLASKGLLRLDSDSQYTVGIGAGRYTNQVQKLWPDEFPLHA